MDHLEDLKWRGVQQGDVIPNGDHTQDSDVNQDLAPSGESQAMSHGGWDDKCDGGERLLFQSYLHYLLRCSWMLLALA